MLETLELRNLNNVYYKINKSIRKEMFYDSINNNLIIFVPLDESIDTESICNGISFDMYNYLINELNNNKNLVVCWSQIEFTTSDYTIYYDFEPRIIKEVKNYSKLLKMLQNETLEHNSMKYNAVKDGRLIPIKRNEINKELH